MRGFARTFLICALLASSGLRAEAVGDPPAQELVARELPAAVSIFVLRAPSAAGLPPGSVAAEQAPGAAHRMRVLGSGFIIDPAGIIVTNRHVIEGAKNILVTLQDHTLLRATLLAQADQIDLALLKVTAETPLPSVRFGDSDALRVADRVLAIGNPLGLGGSVTQGIVSALNRDIRDTPFDDFIQTDATINHGNSGGPLFNTHGEVVGMNTAIFSPEATSGSIGLGFAIPSNDVRFVADALRKPGGMQAGSLDFRIQQVTPEIADALNMAKAEGVIVGGTLTGGGASRCGIIAGDIIMRYGTMPVTDVRALARAIARTPPGTVVDLMVWRNEEPTVIAATVQPLPTARPPVQLVPSPVVAADPGWRLERDGAGVRVTQVVPGGMAAEAGLAAGDVIFQVQQEKVADPADVARLIGGAFELHRRYVAVLASNAEGLRWFALSLE